MPCVTCGTVQAFERAAFDIFDTVSVIVVPIISDVLAGIVVLFFIYVGVWKIILARDVDFGWIGKELLWIITAAGLIGSGTYMWWKFISFFLYLGPWIGVKILNAFTDYNSEYDGLAGLLDSAEAAIYLGPFNAIFNYAGEVNLVTDSALGVFTVVSLIVVYGVLAYQVTKGFIESFLAILTVGIISDVIKLFIAIEPLRVNAVGAVRELLVASLEYIVESAKLGIILSMMVGAFTKWDLSEARIEEGSPLAFEVLIAGIFLLLLHGVMRKVVGRIMLTYGQGGGSGGLIRSIISKMTGV